MGGINLDKEFAEEFKEEIEEKENKEKENIELEDGEEWVNWNDILSDEDKMSENINKAFKKK